MPGTKVLPLRFTRFGTYYILFSFAVGAAAINTGNNILYLILGLQLGSIILSGFLSELCLWGSRAGKAGGTVLYAGRPGEVNLEMQRGRFPAVSLALEFHWSEEPVSTAYTYWTAGRQSQILSCRITPRRRGWLSPIHLRWVTRFPFGLFEKSRTHSTDVRWCVFPAVYPLAPELKVLTGRMGSAAAQRRSLAGVVPYELRDYRPGDSSKRIHWKASAKRQRFMVKEMEEDQDSGTVLVVSTWPAAQTPAETREAFVSFAASLVKAFSDEGRPVGLYTPGAAFDPEASPRQLRRLFTYLALVDLDAERAHHARVPRTPLYGTVDVVDLWEEYKSRWRVGA